jgi:glycosyltransferase involved in cell wall biosynthesis
VAQAQKEKGLAESGRRREGLRLLVFNLATDADDPILIFTTTWLRGLAARVASIDVITMRRGRVALPANVRVFSLKKELGWSEPRRGVEFYRVLMRLLLRSSYDVCFAHQAPLFSIMAAPLLRLRRVPIIMWYAHGAITLQLRAAEKLVSEVVTSSPHAFRLPSRKLTVTGQGVQTALYSPGPPKPEPPPLTLLAVGRIGPVKRLESVVDAMRLLRGRLPEVQLRLVGPVLDQDRAYADHIRRRAERGGLDEAIRFVGPMPSTELVHEYRRAHLLVNATAPGSFDKVVLEAMSCATPVVSSSSAYAPILREVDPRLWVPPDDPAAMAEACERVLRLPAAKRAALGARLRAVVQRDHSLDRLMNLFVHEVFARHGHRRRKEGEGHRRTPA